MRRQGISPSIFRAYDIRGIYPSEIDERAAYLIARAFAHQVRMMSEPPSGGTKKRLRMLVSSDARQSSPSLKESFVRGLLEEGVQVIDAGLTTTPMHTFCVHHTKADGGAMITASHNPAQFNGIKLMGPGGVPIAQGSGIEEIGHVAQRAIFSRKVSRGSIKKENFLPAYLHFFKAKFSDLASAQHCPLPSKKKCLLMFDTGNGMVGLILRKLLEQFPIFQFKILYEETDMTFPHHEANPIKPENMRDLQKAIQKNSVVLGAAFDGDGDRVGFVDEKGESIPGDFIIALLGRYFLEKSGSKEAVVFDGVRASRVVREEIEQIGGRAIEERVGHSFIKLAMRREHAIFGGEMSGHFYFKDFFNAESALFALLTILDILRRQKKLLSELVKPLKRYAKTPELNIAISKREVAMDRLASHFADANISWIDGVRIVYPHWWVNARPAANEDLLRINIEADTPKLLEEKKKEIWNLLKQ
jgi:phosphomannomutase